MSLAIASASPLRFRGNHYIGLATMAAGSGIATGGGGFVVGALLIVLGQWLAFYSSRDYGRAETFTMLAVALAAWSMSGLGGIVMLAFIPTWLATPFMLAVAALGAGLVAVAAWDIVRTSDRDGTVTGLAHLAAFLTALAALGYIASLV
jgi:hypothetical protein